MYQELLEALKKVKLIEAGDIVIPNASVIAHDKKYKLLVWWYNLTDSTLLISKTAIHTDFNKFPKLMSSDVDTAIWIKGRVFNHNKQNCILLYTMDLEGRGIRLTGQILADLVWEIQNKSNLSISVVVDEPGHLLYGE